MLYETAQFEAKCFKNVSDKLPSPVTEPCFHVCFISCRAYVAASAGLQSQQWGRKKAAALAAARLAEDGADALRPHVLALLNALLAEVRRSP